MCSHLDSYTHLRLHETEQRERLERARMRRAIRQARPKRRAKRRGRNKYTPLDTAKSWNQSDKEDAVLPARLNVVTLGASDLPHLRDFYAALGWKPHSDDDQFVRFDLGGAVLALYPLELLADEAAQPPLPRDGHFTGITLAVIVEDPEAVDRGMSLVHDAGGNLLAPPTDRPWGGRSGYFADPEGNPWELAWLPGATFAGRGELAWPN